MVDLLENTTPFVAKFKIGPSIRGMRQQADYRPAQLSVFARPVPGLPVASAIGDVESFVVESFITEDLIRAANISLAALVVLVAGGHLHLPVRPGGLMVIHATAIDDAPRGVELSFLGFAFR